MDLIRTNDEWRIDASLMKNSKALSLTEADRLRIGARMKARLRNLEEQFEALEEPQDLTQVSNEDFRIEMNCAELNKLWNDWNDSVQKTEAWILAQTEFLKSLDAPPTNASPSR